MKHKPGRAIEPCHSFVLRCWQEPEGEGEFAWRFSLTQINGIRTKKGFASFPALAAYLQQALAAFDQNRPGGKQQ